MSARGGRRGETATETAAKARPQTLRLASPLAAARLPSRRRGARWLGGAGTQPARRRDPSTGGHASSSSEEGAGERGGPLVPGCRATFRCAPLGALAAARNKQTLRPRRLEGCPARSCAPCPTLLKAQPGPGKRPDGVGGSAAPSPHCPVLAEGAGGPRPSPGEEPPASA